MAVEMVLEGKILKSVLNGLKVLVSEAKWRINEEGLQSRVADPSNVAMVVVEIPRDGMETLLIDEETVVGVDINRLSEIVKNVKEDSLVELNVDDSTLGVKIGSLRYKVSLIDPSAIRREPKTPTLDFPAKIVMSARQFKEAINFVSKISDEVSLVSDEKEFKIVAEGDVDSIMYRLDKYELIEFNGAEARSNFSVEYLMGFCKVVPKKENTSNTTLTIYLGTDYPVRLDFDIGGKVKISYFLAPRISSE